MVFNRRGRELVVRAAAERVLLVHAHPDDETISTGGTIAMLVDRGAEVTVLTCTRGELGDVIPADLQELLGSPAALGRHREGELAAAMAILGVTDYRFLGAADARWPGRTPRSYLDSGMQWGDSGPEPRAIPDPASLTSADIGEVTADIAAVISGLKPDVVISYNARGGYGHPDHIRVHQATRRAAEVMAVPFYAIEPPDSAATATLNTATLDTATLSTATLSIDAGAMLDRKRSALLAHRSQLTVDGARFALSTGEYAPIETVERFRRIPREPVPAAPRQGVVLTVFSSALAILLGLVIGGMLTVSHQATVSMAGATVPLGILSAISITLALLVGLRLVCETRIIPGMAAVGVLAAITLLSATGVGGSILVPANTAGYLWTFAPVVIALVVLAWPRFRRPTTSNIVNPTAVKGVIDQ